MTSPLALTPQEGSFQTNLPGTNLHLNVKRKRKPLGVVARISEATLGRSVWSVACQSITGIAARAVLSGRILGNLLILRWAFSSNPISSTIHFIPFIGSSIPVLSGRVPRPNKHTP